MTAPLSNRETSIFTRSQEPVTVTVLADSATIPEVAYLPGALLPPMEDPNLSDNPELVQAKNRYELARFRTQALGYYAGNVVASFQSDFEQAKQTFLENGGRLSAEGNVL